MTHSLLQPVGRIPLVFIDTETTGVSPDYGHRVTEVGIVRVEADAVHEYQQLLDPQRSISPGITALTGISQAMVSGQPLFSAEVSRILDLMRDAVIIGHNVRFDLSFLASEFHRAGVEMTQAIGADAHVLDTVRIARRRLGRGGNSLGTLARRLGIMPSDAHRALADAQTTRAVFDQLLAPVGGSSCPLCDAITAQGGVIKLPMSRTSHQNILPLELEEALAARTPVMMEYLDANGRRTERMVVPLQVHRSGGDLTLVAFCHLRQAQRTFKLERVVQLKRLDDSRIGP